MDPMIRYVVVLLALVGLLAASPSQVSAALITEVQSSFDKDDPFDIKLSISYQFNSWNSLITRERVAPGTAVSGSQVRPGEVVAANKLEYKRKFHEMHFNMAIGLYHELELVFDIPWAFADQASLDYHPSVKSDCADPQSCVDDIDPSTQKWDPDNSPNSDVPLIDLPWQGAGRSGIGNMGFGLRWAPWHYSRDKQYPSWVIGLMIRVPAYTGSWVKKAGNTRIGDGLTHVELNTAISRRVTKWFEPYFDLHGHLRFASDKSLFDNENADTQTLVDPGHSMGLILGTEFIPWEVEANEQFFSIDIGGGLDYVFEGREYGPLFEALGASPCRGVYGCYDTTYSSQPKECDVEINKLKKQKNAAKTAGDQDKVKELEEDIADLEAEKEQKYALKEEDGGFPRTDGITDVEGHGIFSAWFGMYVQPVKFVQLGIRFNLAYLPSYFITFADAGKDQDGDSDFFVSAENTLGNNEYNPKYIEGIDEVGTRFKASRTINWSLLFSLSGKF